MQKYQQEQKKLNGMTDQIQLICIYEQIQDPVQKTMLLSHLKHILLTTPNDIHIPAQQLKNCNDKYLYLILNQIIQSTSNLSSKFQQEKKQQQSLMRMLFYVISLRIKLWFNKMEFENVFSSLLINIEHNRKMIPMVVEFFIQLIDVFEDKGVGDQSGEGDKVNGDQSEDGRSACMHSSSATRSYPMMRDNHHNNTSRQSLTRKTNNSLFLDQQITRKTQRARKQLHQTIRKKSFYRKQNKFQRQFLDYELNKLLTFANQCFNRAVVQNPKYDYEQQQLQVNQQQDQQPAYFIKMPIQHITKILQLIHRVLMFDFLGERQRNLHDEYFQQKMPQIIPSKHTKYNRFEEIQNWVKNKNDAYKYQFIYFISNNIELKIQIVRIFGDMLRIHQKFFKKDIIFKTHVETVVMLIKNMLQNLQIKYNEQFQLAIVFGQSISKLLLNSTFPTFLNSSKPQFKKEFIQSVSGFIHKEILDLGVIDVRLVKNYFGFFGEMYQRLMINSSEHFRIKDFKEQIQLIVKGLTNTYEGSMYQSLYRNDDTLLKQFPKFYSINTTVKQLNMDSFETFLAIFKFHQPNKQFQGNFTLGQSMLWICSRVQFNFYQYEFLVKQSERDSKQMKKIDVVRRHCLQCFVRLVEVIGKIDKQQPQNAQQDNRENKQIQLMQYKYKLITATFVCERILSNKAHVVLIFQESGQLFSFIKHVINMYFQIKLMMIKDMDREIKHQAQQIEKQRLPVCQQGSAYFNELNNLHHHALILFSLVTKLTEHTFIQHRKANMMIKQMRQLDLKIASTSKRQRKNQHSKNKIYGKTSNNDDLQIVENMKKECEDGQRQLEYFEGVVKMIAKIVGRANDDSNCKDSEENETNLVQCNKQHAIIMKALQTIKAKDKQLDRVVKQLYRMYFVTLSKYELHRKMHCSLVKDSKEQQLSQNINQKQQQLHLLSIRKNSQSFYSQSNQQDDDDQCSIIQQEDVLVDNMKTKQLNNQLHRCNTTIETHNLHKHMTVVGYWVYLQYALTDEQIKQQLEEGFIDWFGKNTNNNATNDNNNDQHNATNNNNPLKSKSYLQLYSLQSILIILVNQYFIKDKQPLTKQSQQQRKFLLKITSMLMKLFRQSKYQINIKKHILTAFTDFIHQNFQQIERHDYKLSQRINYYYDDNHSLVVVGEQQQQQDELMACRVQAMVNMLESMVNLYFMQFTINIFNLQFLHVFNCISNGILQIQKQQQDKDQEKEKEDNLKKKTTKISPLQCKQLQQLINLFINTKTISRMFVNVIKFVLQFPEEYLQNGWYRNIQTQFIRLIREVYYEFSQFTTIFMFGLDQETEQMQDRVMRMGLGKVLLCGDDNYNNNNNHYNPTIINNNRTSFFHFNCNTYQKYAITITNNNIPNVIHSYSILIQYINKVVWLSYISPQSKQWLMIRNRQSLPFIKQIYEFIYQIKRWNDNKNEEAEQQKYLQKTRREQQQFYQSLTKLLYTLFEFINYFLTNFENIGLQFVTEHLSLIETIYQLVQISRNVGDLRVEKMIDEKIGEMEKIVVFIRVKEEEQLSYSSNNSNSNSNSNHYLQVIKKPSTNKNHTLFSSKNTHHSISSHHNRLYQIQAPKYYTGWKYIKKLYQSSQTDILQEVETYQLEYKYRARVQIKKDMRDSQRQDNKTITGGSNLQQSQDGTVYEEEQQKNRKSIYQEDRRSRQNKLAMSSLKKIRPLLQQSSTINNQMNQMEDEWLKKDQYRQCWEQKQQLQYQGYSYNLDNYHANNKEDNYNQLQRSYQQKQHDKQSITRKSQQSKGQSDNDHQLLLSVQEKEIEKESQSQGQQQHNQQQPHDYQQQQRCKQQQQSISIINDNLPPTIYSPPSTQYQLPVILQQSHIHIHSSKSKPSTTKHTIQQSLQQQPTNDNQQQRQNKSSQYEQQVFEI